LVGIATPERGAVSALLLLGREHRVHLLDLDSVFLLDPIHQVVRLGKEKLGVNGEKPKGPADARRHVDQHHTFGSERRRNRHAVSEMLERPREGTLRSPRLGGLLDVCNQLIGVSHHLFFHESGSSLVVNSVEWKSAKRATGSTLLSPVGMAVLPN
jgi:hypothetical protein